MSTYPHIPERLNVAAVTIDCHVTSGRGDHPALFFGDKSYTYRYLQKSVMSVQLAAAFGPRSRDRLLIRLGQLRIPRDVSRRAQIDAFLFHQLAVSALGARAHPTTRGHGLVYKEE